MVIVFTGFNFRRSMKNPRNSRKLDTTKNSCHTVADCQLTFVFRLKGKFRWLSEELKARLSTERRLKEQADWSQKRIRVGTASDQKHNAQGSASA